MDARQMHKLAQHLLPYLRNLYEAILNGEIRQDGAIEIWQNFLVDPDQKRNLAWAIDMLEEEIRWRE